MKTSLVALAMAMLLSACAIRQQVRPVERFEDKQVCIIENSSVKHGFLAVYRRALTQKGYEVRMLPASAALNECPIVSTYSANWRWDLASYMAYAEIKVYQNAKPSGEALYDSTHGGGNMNKFISAESKIMELVNQLFPGGSGR